MFGDKQQQQQSQYAWGGGGGQWAGEVGTVLSLLAAAVLQ